ncbi:MAG: pyridoxal-phosphate dependent enzyme [Mycobacteriales bacterium]
MIVPTATDVREAAAALIPYVARTPVLRSDALDAAAGCHIVAKAECLQITGSFKVRGALNRIRALTPEQRSAGLITISAGNAALGAAHAAKEFGARLTVVMPESAVPEKLAAVEGYGGVVVKEGITSATIAFERAAQLQAEQGLTLVHPFDDPMVVSGAATATLELLEDNPAIDRLYVPCSGGGLLSGALLAVATLGADVTVIGVQPEGSDGIVRSLAAGEPTAVPHVSTVADGLTAPRPGALNFAIIRDAGISIRTVSDDQILAAMRVTTRALRVVLEPAAAAGVAGLLADPDRSSRTSAVLLSGSNVNWELLAKTVC